MLVNCRNCGKSIGDNTLFCPHCGTGAPVDKGDSNGCFLVCVIIILILGLIGALS